MTLSITLLLASLLIIGVLRVYRESRNEISAAEQEIESSSNEETSEVLPEPQAEIIIENPPHQAEVKKTAKKPVQKKDPAPVKKTSVKKTETKKVPAKKAPAKK
jgi:outer membrane biosynthesis protein TonB